MLGTSKNVENNKKQKKRKKSQAEATIAENDERKSNGSFSWWRNYSCISGNKSPRASRSFSRSNTLPLQQKLSPAEVKYESYVKATVAANAKSPVEDLLPKHMTPPTPPPPPPPRRHAGQNKIFSPESNNSMDFAKSPSHSVGPLLSPLSTSTTEGTSVDAQTLFNIRQQMALSLKRMKDLEEQVRTIPEMQFELNQLREEKKRLQQSLQMKQEELQRQRPSPSPSPSPLASPKYASPVQFTPQRISPISLESLGARLRTSSVTSSSSERPKAVLKREVGTMCGQLHTTRDIAVGSPVATLRTVGTSPAQRVRLSEMLYTEFQMNEQIEIAIKIYEEKRTLQNLKKLISVGTQMYVPQRADLRDSGMQTTIERAIQKYNVGVTAKPATRDNFVSCKPQLRDVGTSEHRITDILCERCATHKRTVACGTDEILDDKNRVAVSLKFLELSGRSNTFTLGDNEKLNVKRKTIGTQYTPMIVLHNTGCQTVIPLAHSIGIQISPETQSMSTQSQIDVKNIQTDTRDLIRLCATQTSTEEIAAPINPPSPIIEIRTIEVPMPVPVPKKPETRNTASNTEKPKTIESGVNTAPPVSIRHSSSNTDSVRKRDIGCGEIVKPHISISCADNYCDSCKDAIRVLAKEFTPHTPSKLVAPAGGPGPLLRANSDLSRIPRPKHITSPSPVRKPFQRQNTYTITPSPTPSPKADKKIIARALQEKPPSPSPAAVTVNVAQQEEFSKENYSFLNQQIRQSESRTALSEQSQSTASVETVIAQEPLKQQASPTPSQESSKTFDMPLIVKEEKRVSISWSRDASPAPSMTQSREGRKSLESSFNENVKENLELAKKNLELSKKQIAEQQQQQQQQQQEEEDTDVSKGARRKTSPSKSSQSGHVAREEDEALMQKLATIETEPRQKYTPSKELQRALKLINDSLLKKLGAKPISSVSLKASKATIQQEWFRISSTEKANPHEVEDHLDAFETLSVPLLEYCVNLSDGNGNTAMHYAVSHGNFDVVSILLDSKVCNVNQLNNAGYTSVMLVSLAKLKDPAHRTVVERLFQMADVNIRAKKHCQTALMLAVSHGNSDMVQMLLAAGADINIQDEDGSTALMCAAEHGRVDIVKQLLSKSECDSLLQDVDGSTAFKIAWQAGHKDIGLLLYVHEQMLRSKMPNRGINIDIRTSSISPKLFKNTK